MHATDRLRIDTPEQVALELPIAGVGSRFVAIAIDTLLQAVLYAAAFFTILLAALAGFAFRWSFLGRSVASVLPALVLLFLFCVYWGYFALFEIFWKGQTPGKRWAGIRVIKDSGRPIDVYAAVARNLMRAIDFLPAMYAAGIICMVLNRHSRRLGDFVAGTVVVHDRLPERGAADLPAPPSDATRAPAAAHITAEELAVIEMYLQRRPDLDWDIRREAALRLVRRIFERTGVRPDQGQNVDDFLEALARQARDAARYRRGPS